MRTYFVTILTTYQAQTYFVTILTTYPARTELVSVCSCAPFQLSPAAQPGLFKDDKNHPPNRDVYNLACELVIKFDVKNPGLHSKNMMIKSWQKWILMVIWTHWLSLIIEWDWIWSQQETWKTMAIINVRLSFLHQNSSLSISISLYVYIYTYNEASFVTSSSPCMLQPIYTSK